MQRRFLSVLVAALACAGIAPVLAQTSALKGHNSNAPVDVAADRIEVQDRADRAVFVGNVVVKQAEMTMTSARLTVAYARDKKGNSTAGKVQIERLDASGGVTVTSPTERAVGQFGIYDLQKKIVTLIGAVTLTRGDSKVNGARLTIDLDSGHAVMDGGGAPGTNSSGGRVTGTFTVPQKKS
ncbi:MAG: OstA family protein [Alphaproteobacteria bacterium]|nr:OstA family protein [Alphaproteobacteria bacterium]MDB5719762.1 OstA family protein [Alphaproteobacteria bacterium]